MTSVEWARKRLAAGSNFRVLFGEVAGPDGRLREVNPYWVSLGGAELLERRFVDLVHPDDRAATEAWLRGALVCERSRPFAARLVLVDGGWLDVEWRAQCDVPGSAFLLGTEVPVERRVDRLTRLLSRVAHRTESAVVVADRHGRIEWVNDAFTGLTGYVLSEVQGRTPGSFLHGTGTDPAVRAMMRERLGRGEGFRTEVLNYRKDGSPYWVNLEVQPVHDERGELTHFMSIESDITRAREIDVELQASLASLRGIHDGTRFAVISTDPRGVIRTFNPGAERMLGYRADELVGRVTPQVFHLPEEVAARAKVLSQELGFEVPPGVEVFVARVRTSGADENEWTFVRKDGTRLTALLSVTALRGTDGVLDGFLGVAADVTERRRAQDEQRVLAERLARLGEHVPGMVYQFQRFPDGRGCVPWASVGIRDVYRVTPEQVRDDATVLFQRIHPDDLERVSRTILDSAEHMTRWHCEFRVRFSEDGTERWLWGHSTPQRLADGSTMWHGFIMDITDRKAAESELVRAREAAVESSASLGRLLDEKEVLLKEVHHRVKNNLQVISSLLSLQARRVSEPGTQAALQASQGRVRSIALLHERLYQSNDLANVDMSTYLAGLVSEVFRAAGRPGVRRQVSVEGLELSMELAMPCGLIVNELVTNALKHAFPAGEGEVRVELTKSDGRVRLSVVDDGCGLPRSAAGEVSSLGMKLVRSLTDQLRGRLVIERGPGERGTAFRVDFFPGGTS